MIRDGLVLAIEASERPAEDTALHDQPNDGVKPLARVEIPVHETVIRALDLARIATRLVELRPELLSLAS